ncbi:hypothetical protein K469DRAFT_746820 [Zopfia rhizophila CBS 207.26]|uniref:Uncharacterized protein n=1 Tax=Zopfia rhizophila CBS 207.26 TaxID=1314779 RepID=A0A6A6EN47_9PEZI|nr:hypothetical protein K469DRAFT_746820 [Zopfia rhizophila CBS 207.26]
MSRVTGVGLAFRSPIAGLPIPFNQDRHNETFGTRHSSRLSMEYKTEEEAEEEEDIYPTVEYTGRYHPTQAHDDVGPIAVRESTSTSHFTPRLASASRRRPEVLGEAPGCPSVLYSSSEGRQNTVSNRRTMPIGATAYQRPTTYHSVAVNGNPKRSRTPSPPSTQVKRTKRTGIEISSHLRESARKRKATRGASQTPADTPEYSIPEGTPAPSILPRAQEQEIKDEHDVDHESLSPKRRLNTESLELRKESEDRKDLDTSASRDNHFLSVSTQKRLLLNSPKQPSNRPLTNAKDSGDPTTQAEAGATTPDEPTRPSRPILKVPKQPTLKESGKPALEGPELSISKETETDDHDIKEAQPVTPVKVESGAYDFPKREGTTVASSSKRKSVKMSLLKKTLNKGPNRKLPEHNNERSPKSVSQPKDASLNLNESPISRSGQKLKKNFPSSGPPKVSKLTDSASNRKGQAKEEKVCPKKADRISSAPQEDVIGKSDTRNQTETAKKAKIKSKTAAQKSSTPAKKDTIGKSNASHNSAKSSKEPPPKSAHKLATSQAPLKKKPGNRSKNGKKSKSDEIIVDSDGDDEATPQATQATLSVGEKDGTTSSSRNGTSRKARHTDLKESLQCNLAAAECLARVDPPIDPPEVLKPMECNPESKAEPAEKQLEKRQELRVADFQERTRYVQDECRRSLNTKRKQEIKLAPQTGAQSQMQRQETSTRAGDAGKTSFVCLDDRWRDQRSEVRKAERPNTERRKNERNGITAETTRQPVKPKTAPKAARLKLVVKSLKPNAQEEQSTINILPCGAIGEPLEPVVPGDDPTPQIAQPKSIEESSKPVSVDERLVSNVERPEPIQTSSKPVVEEEGATSKFQEPTLIVKSQKPAIPKEQPAIIDPQSQPIKTFRKLVDQGERLPPLPRPKEEGLSPSGENIARDVHPELVLDENNKNPVQKDDNPTATSATKVLTAPENLASTAHDVLAEQTNDQKPAIGSPEVLQSITQPAIQNGLGVQILSSFAVQTVSEEAVSQFQETEIAKPADNIDKRKGKARVPIAEWATDENLQKLSENHRRLFELMEAEGLPLAKAVGRLNEDTGQSLDPSTTYTKYRFALKAASISKPHWRKPEQPTAQASKQNVAESTPKGPVKQKSRITKQKVNKETTERGDASKVERAIVSTATSSKVGTGGTPSASKAVRIHSPLAEPMDIDITVSIPEETCATARPRPGGKKHTETSRHHITDAASDNEDAYGGKIDVEVEIDSEFEASNVEMTNTNPFSGVIRAPSPATKADVPFFEYVVRVKVLEEGQNEEDAAWSNPVGMQKYENLDEANRAADNTQKYVHANLRCNFREWGWTLDKFDCKAWVGRYITIKDGKTAFYKISVERWVVYQCEQRLPTNKTSFLNKVVYTVHLYKLVQKPGEDYHFTELDDPADADWIREHMDISPNNVFTLLDDANRKARQLQLGLSTKGEPRTVFERNWKTSELVRLQTKLDELEKKDACWKEAFPALGGEWYEVEVKEGRITGPRNV